MAGGDIGGDGSVEWRFFVDNVRRSAIRNCTIGDTGYEQGGVDETDPGEKFTVGIKIPQSPEEFVKTLRAAADEAERHMKEPGYIVRFTLPIESKNSGQIQIRWNSAPVKPAAAAPARTAKKAGRGKRRVR